jgi:hypothetical protein
MAIDLLSKATACIVLSLTDMFLTRLICEDRQSLRKLRNQDPQIMYWNASPPLHKRYRRHNQQTSVIF